MHISNSFKQHKYAGRDMQHLPLKSKSCIVNNIDELVFFFFFIKHIQAGGETLLYCMKGILIEITIYLIDIRASMHAWEYIRNKKKPSESCVNNICK